MEERSEHATFNKIGSRLFNRRIRRERSERLERSAIEMRAFGGSGPSASDPPF
jgi:hypothetical protein